MHRMFKQYSYTITTTFSQLQNSEPESYTCIRTSVTFYTTYKVGTN